MSRAVVIDGARVELAPAQLLGQGGEAEVYDLGDGRVLKWWKPADHPDFEGLPAAQDAARKRLAEARARLHALASLPARLPPSVVLPCGVALAAAGGELAGYLMPKVTGTPLHAYGEPRWRRDHPIDGAEVVAALLALRDAIADLHRAGVVIGDCNDLNVLVDRTSLPSGSASRSARGGLDGCRVHLIDVDSYQLPGFPCTMFSERFVDPRLCDATPPLAPVRPHDEASDWFAFAAMAFRTLLGVSPWGGVHPRIPAGHRALRRVSVMSPGVVYPRASRPLAILADDTLDAFRAIFERDARGVFARDILERIQLRRCASCGDEHARTRCPSCQTVAAPLRVTGALRHEPIALAEVAPGTFEVTTATRPVWLDGGTLMRDGRFGGSRIGGVLAGQTRAWCNAKLGVGFYRAGGFAVGFTFRPDRGVLDDRVALPKIRGRLVDAHAVVGDDRAWLFLTTDGVTTVVVIGADATILATATLTEPWLIGAHGAVAAGPHLFVPTDDGIARIEVAHGAIAHTRTFSETAPLVAAGDRLALHAHGLDAIRRHDVIRLHLS